MNRQNVIAGLVVCVLLLVQAPVMAGSHSWDIVEIFSNSDGTIQFVELQEQNGLANEVGLNDKWVRANIAGNQFDFPGNLSGNTSNAHLLLATAGFAALPGAPTPDYEIPPNFFDLNDDFLEYWTYDDFDFPAGALPLNGKDSLSGDGTTGPNTPTNFAGESGTVDACPSDYDGDGFVGINDFLFVLGNWGTPAGDIDGDNDTGIAEFLSVLGNWGAC